ncbi:hypothetical protein RM780_04060 [Streptomyces sp. DSM 44917]|uniref:Uncharacterized protein n=1 Tax=Streptomyces boetiae TaxID=3075541 RepID=A0ABU2L3J7_9ACTN|nr:hypothetical protein [Streptomyces sp. DSM 44917]MDT0306137.1 hypothetical protein [Streptomyces sp. DSM 44917]
MAAPGRDEPPTGWVTPALTCLTDGIYYGWIDGVPNPVFWHWCEPSGRWLAVGTAAHTLVAREPLHLEASLLWTCCGLHGFVRDGKWIPA